MILNPLKTHPECFVEYIDFFKDCGRQRQSGKSEFTVVPLTLIPS